MAAAPAAWTSIPFDVSSRLDVTGGGTPDPIDLDLGSALRDPDATGEGARAARTRDSSGQTTREMTVKMTPAGSEAPTVEQPALRPLDEPTIREKVEGAMRRKLSSDQTAELALDDLGLDLGSLEQTDSQIGLKPSGGMPRGNDANAPTMVAGLDENSQRLLAAAAARSGAKAVPTIAAHRARRERHLVPDGARARRRRGSDQGPFHRSEHDRVDGEVRDAGRGLRHVVDLAPRGARSQQSRLPRRADASSSPRWAGAATSTSISARRAAITSCPAAPTEELALPDLEPVTLSEVGTKLDLARAYVDMGDPDGARNILNEVLSEGSASQKQEAQRLIESLPG